jgi:cytochrome b
MGQEPITPVWDLPIRIVHWGLVSVFTFAWWSAETGHFDWHRKAGLCLLMLLAFRLMWGIVGSSTARFVSFVKGPRQVFSYLQGNWGPSPGHNPLGGWSVVAMLSLLLAQVASGLVAVDVDGIESGPLSYLVDFDTARLSSAIHSWTFNVLLGLVTLHVLAIAFYQTVRRRNLITPMITGQDRQAAALQAPVRAGRLSALAICIGLACLIIWWIANGAPV